MDTRFLPENKFLEFKAENEPWAQYTLENGVVLRVRIMLVKVKDEGLWEEGPSKGQPKYNFAFQQVMDIDYPLDIQAEIKRRLGE